jgi:hypothetical protein
MRVYKPWFLRNEPTVFRVCFERILRPAKSLELWKTRFPGGVVLENEPTGTPQEEGFGCRDNYIAASRPTRLGKRTHRDTTIRPFLSADGVVFTMLLPVRITLRASKQLEGFAAGIRRAASRLTRLHSFPSCSAWVDEATGQLESWGTTSPVPTGETPILCGSPQWIPSRR